MQMAAVKLQWLRSNWTMNRTQRSRQINNQTAREKHFRRVHLKTVVWASQKNNMCGWICQQFHIPNTKTWVCWHVRMILRRDWKEVRTRSATAGFCQWQQVTDVIKISWPSQLVVFIVTLHCGVDKVPKNHATSSVRFSNDLKEGICKGGASAIFWQALTVQKQHTLGSLRSSAQSHKCLI